MIDREINLTNYSSLLARLRQRSETWEEDESSLSQQILTMLKEAGMALKVHMIKELNWENSLERTLFAALLGMDGDDIVLYLLESPYQFAYGFKGQDEFISLVREYAKARYPRWKYYGVRFALWKLSIGGLL